jgi:hypothetical protein
MVHCEWFYSLQYNKWTIRQYAWEMAAEFQNEITAANDQNLHAAEAYSQKEKFTQTSSPSKATAQKVCAFALK